MKKTTYIFLAFLFLLTTFTSFSQEQRFPKPEFETGYVQPSPETPEPRTASMELVDVAILLLVISLASYFAIRRRSRTGILGLTLFTLLYFGFYRNGCICSIGAIQNITLAFTDPTYAISISALLFFLIPLIYTLLFGRTFCAGACPLGAIQDLVIIQPISIPRWLRKTLGIIPFIYLGLAVLYAATGTDFIICRYDPFIGIFRMDAEFHMVILGIAFLLMGMFVARPYCRFLCPYGVLLNWMSRFSKWHLSITPSKCIQCKLCTTSCPFDAIDFPIQEKPANSRSNVRKFILYALLIPVWMVAGSFVGMKLHKNLAKAHPDVYLAELLISQPELIHDEDNIDVQTFMASGKPLEALIEEAKAKREDFYMGSIILGAFIGLVIGSTIMNQVVFRRREIYQPNRADCFSCGRCMDYCPVEK